MTEEIKTEVAPVTEVVKPDTITVDIEGISLEVPLDTGKKLIEARQKAKKEVKDLQDKVSKSEAVAKQESDKNALLKAMRESDIDSVKAQVSQEYIDKINQYENKIFKGEIKSLLATAGVLPSALDDAVNLAMSGVKATLDGESIKLGDKPAKEAVDEFIKTRPHLIAVQANSGKKLTTPVVPKSSGDFQKFTQTLFSKK